MNAVECHRGNVWFQDVIAQIWIWTLWAFSVDRLLNLTSPLPHLLFQGTLLPPPHPILYFWLLYNMGLIRSHWNDLRTPNIFCGGMPPDPPISDWPQMLSSPHKQSLPINYTSGRNPYGPIELMQNLPSFYF